MMSANRHYERTRIDYLKLVDEHGWWVIAVLLAVIAILSRAGLL